MVRLVASYGRIVPVRQGWYAVPEVPKDSLRAWRAGGRLTCISAAVQHGLWAHDVDALHVRVAANASRVERSPRVVLHWSRAAVTGSRLAVSVEEALQTIRRCQPAEVFHAIRRAANR
ncbi:hypothetical protein [Conyzicola nivalis]|nr:hypothetical protein [Conyzicola nivalis]